MDRLKLTWQKTEGEIQIMILAFSSKRYTSLKNDTPEAQAPTQSAIVKKYGHR